jgi:hypothetical protein
MEKPYNDKSITITPLRTQQSQTYMYQTKDLAKYMKQTLIKLQGEIKKSRMTVEFLNSFLTTDRTRKQNISKDRRNHKTINMM